MTATIASHDDVDEHAPGSRVCAACGSRVPLGRGCELVDDARRLSFGCVACRAAWLDGTESLAACEDCLDLAGSGSPASEWACY
jgi:hypothetical protein